MIVPAYVPGEWFAVVTDGTVAVLPPETAPAVLAELWTAIREGAGLTDHLQVLLRTGFTHVPPFALVALADGQVHAIVRGRVRVEVVTDTGTQVLSGAHVSTWAEDVLTDVRSVAVRTGDTTPERGSLDHDAMPVLAAVVRVRDVLVDLRSSVVASESSPAVPGWAPEVVAPVGPGPAVEPRPTTDRWDEPAYHEAVQEAAQQVGNDRYVPVPRPPVAADPPQLVPVPPTRPNWEPIARAVRPAAPEPPTQAPPAGDHPHDRGPHDDRGHVTGPSSTVGDPSYPAPVRVSVGAAGNPGDPFGLPHAGAAVPYATEDHDGFTVLSSDVVALRRQLPAWAGDAVPALAVPTPRTPPPAKLLMSSGLTVALNRPVLIGRAPQVTRVQNNDIPRLLTVASPNQDISRTHAEVRMDGEDVIVIDLRSTNGVLLLRQGAGPQRLHPGEPTVVEPGVVVDLGEGVTFIVEAGG